MDTILITGADGFFASRFIQYYKEKYNIVALNHSKLDITNEKETITMVKKINPVYLVHTAAISDTGLCEKNYDLSYNVNVKGAINMAKACEISNSKLIYLSSEQVYNGNIEEGPYSEECEAKPNTVYGNHKLEAENEIKKIVPQTVILRLTWLFGLPERNKKTNSNIVWNVLCAAIKNQPIKLPTHEYRGMTYVYNLLQNFPKILDLPGGIYNTGSENNLTTYEIATIILKEMALDYRINDLLIRDDERYKGTNRDLRICNSKLAKYGILFEDTKDAVRTCINDSKIC